MEEFDKSVVGTLVDMGRSLTLERDEKSAPDYPLPGRFSGVADRVNMTYGWQPTHGRHGDSVFYNPEQALNELGRLMQEVAAVDCSKIADEDTRGAVEQMREGFVGLAQICVLLAGK